MILFRWMVLLLALGMVRKASSGRLLPTAAHVTASGEIKTRAVRHYQEDILALASESVKRSGANVPCNCSNGRWCSAWAFLAC